MGAPRRRLSTKNLNAVDELLVTNQIDLVGLRCLLQRLERSADDLAKANKAPHAHMKDDNVLADMDSVLVYKDQTVGSVGLLKHDIQELVTRTPGIAGSDGNEEAYSITRDLTDRASPPPPRMNTRDALLTYHDITLHYRLSRLTFPPPHKSFSQHQQHLWRHLQARTFLTRARLALFHP
ncbi:hypothetical protein HPB51_017968 [Rhipicephalus microplus]|uniref:Tick transposon n=1 Tax=Rhipicephalus microplus TaxID=6941 RepID=A0A9J6D5X2_RHIMP|nr:hypothetical protein HPB51_017968 [Rhipicephalus microplus]